MELTNREGVSFDVMYWIGAGHAPLLFHRTVIQSYSHTVILSYSGVTTQQYHYTSILCSVRMRCSPWLSGAAVFVCRELERWKDLRGREGGGEE